MDIVSRISIGFILAFILGIASTICFQKIVKFIRKHTILVLRNPFTKEGEKIYNHRITRFR